MKRFRFRLARLERIRDLRRREARAALARALGESHDASEGRIRQQENLDAALSLELEGEMAQDARALRGLAAWRDYRRRCLDDARRVEDEAQQRATDSSGRHTEAARDHRALERLRERRHARWLDEVTVDERKFLDEAHLLRLVRRRRHEEDER